MLVLISIQNSSKYLRPILANLFIALSIIAAPLLVYMKDFASSGSSSFISLQYCGCVQGLNPISHMSNTHSTYSLKSSAVNISLSGLNGLTIFTILDSIGFLNHSGLDIYRSVKYLSASCGLVSALTQLLTWSRYKFFLVFMVLFYCLCVPKF